MLTSSPYHTIFKKLRGHGEDCSEKKREIFLKNLGLYNEKGQSDQEHLYFIFYCGFIFYENLGDCY